MRVLLKQVEKQTAREIHHLQFQWIAITRTDLFGRKCSRVNNFDVNGYYYFHFQDKLLQ